MHVTSLSCYPFRARSQDTDVRSSRRITGVTGVRPQNIKNTASPKRELDALLYAGEKPIAEYGKLPKRAEKRKFADRENCLAKTEKQTEQDRAGGVSIPPRP